MKKRSLQNKCINISTYEMLYLVLFVSAALPFRHSPTLDVLRKYVFFLGSLLFKTKSINCLLLLLLPDKLKTLTLSSQHLAERNAVKKQKQIMTQRWKMIQILVSSFSYFIQFIVFNGALRVSIKDILQYVNYLKHSHTE